MSLADQLLLMNLQLYGPIAIALATIALTLSYTFPYLADPRSIRAYPGPWLAKFSCLWLARVTRVGRVQTSVKEMHDKYGMTSRNILLMAHCYERYFCSYWT